MPLLHNIIFVFVTHSRFMRFSVFSCSGLTTFLMAKAFGLTTTGTWHPGMIKRQTPTRVARGLRSIKPPWRTKKFFSRPNCNLPSVKIVVRFLNQSAARITEISIPCLCYTTNHFFGSSRGIADAVSCYMHLEVDAQKVDHLVLI
jgi:hypothetical protein